MQIDYGSVDPVVTDPLVLAFASDDAVDGVEFMFATEFGNRVGSQIEFLDRVERGLEGPPPEFSAEAVGEGYGHVTMSDAHGCDVGVEGDRAKGQAGAPATGRRRRARNTKNVATVSDIATLDHAIANG